MRPTLDEYRNLWLCINRSCDDCLVWDFCDKGKGNMNCHLNHSVLYVDEKKLQETYPKALKDKIFLKKFLIRLIER